MSNTAMYTPGALTRLVRPESEIAENEQETQELNDKKQNAKNVAIKMKKLSQLRQKDSQNVSQNATVTPSGSNDYGDISDAEPPSKRNKQRKPVNPAEEQEQLTRTVFVGNLPTDVTRKTIKLYFSNYGKVETVRIRSIVSADPKLPKKAAFIKKTLNDNLQSVNAYVRFSSVKEAKKALKANASDFQCRKIRVDSCSGGKKYNDKTTVFIGNLSFNITDDQLHEHFADCGTIEAVRIVRSKETGEGKGFGFVSFKNEGALLLALKLNGHSLLNRSLRIKKVTKMKKKQKMVSGKKSIAPLPKKKLNSAENPKFAQGNRVEKRRLRKLKQKRTESKSLMK